MIAFLLPLWSPSFSLHAPRWLAPCSPTVQVPCLNHPATFSHLHPPCSIFFLLNLPQWSLKSLMLTLNGIAILTSFECSAYEMILCFISTSINETSRLRIPALTQELPECQRSLVCRNWQRHTADTDIAGLQWRQPHLACAAPSRAPQRSPLSDRSV